MALDRAFAELQRCMSDLLSALTVLGTTVDQDRPIDREGLLVAQLADDVLAARGFIEEAYSAAVSARNGIESWRGSFATRKALSECQESFQRFTSVFFTNLTSYERINDLVRVDLERGEKWSRWVEEVRQELQRCRSCADQVSKAAFVCWEELVERATLGSISIGNLSIEQNFGPAESPGS